MPVKSRYKLVKLESGVSSVHSVEHEETFHPVVGPVAEAEALYVRQLRLVQRMQSETGEFVIWDVGLGAAANVLSVLRAASELPVKIRIVSFDHTIAALRFAFEHAEELGYFNGFEATIERFLAQGAADFQFGKASVAWQLILADFPSLLRDSLATRLKKPHAILFDAFSPAKNAAMWTLPVFSDLYRLLDPTRPCALPTYSRSTMLRVTLLMAGFHVGTGHATGEKEETTIAANTPDLIDEPLGLPWLERVAQSTSAEPLIKPVYRQARLSPDSWEQLKRHSQFQSAVR
ncbi:MAG: hypothetical protein EXS31_09340 [Pedosphaera sp.]|nr:hypothetical protein [Pedosphaera sp.]